MSLRNIRIKRRIPAWVWFIIFAIILLLVVTYFVVKPFRIWVNETALYLLNSSIYWLLWFVTTIQYWGGIATASLFAILIFGRKYIWGKKATVLQSNPPARGYDSLSTSDGLFDEDLKVSEA